MKKALPIIVVILLVMGAYFVYDYLMKKNAKPTLSVVGENVEWTPLFNGSTMEGWRGYNSDTLPACWKIQDTYLMVGKTQEGHGGGDIIFNRPYEDFILEMEVKLTEGANSGILYRAKEIANTPIWHSAPEFQILDNKWWDDSTDLEMATHRLAENYDMHASEQDYSKPLGEWNLIKLVVQGNHVEHWLNGNKVVEYDFDSADWETRYQKSKFKEYAEYGRNKLGYIGLQEHGAEVWFRNIRIKDLSQAI